MRSAKDILNRLAEAIGATTDAELALSLNVKRTSISTWRSRGTIAIVEILELAEREGLDLNWLLLGRNVTMSQNVTHRADRLGGAMSTKEEFRQQRLTQWAQGAGLDEVLVMADRGASIVAWRLLKLLGGRSEPFTAQELRDELASQGLSLQPRELWSELAVLRRYGLLNEVATASGELYSRADFYKLHSKGLPEIAEHLVTAIQDLVGPVMDAVSSEPSQGKIVTAWTQVNPEDVKELIDSTMNAVKTKWEEASKKHGTEEVRLVLGMAKIST